MITILLWTRYNLFIATEAQVHRKPVRAPAGPGLTKQGEESVQQGGSERPFQNGQAEPSVNWVAE